MNAIASLRKPVTDGYRLNPLTIARQRLKKHWSIKRNSRQYFEALGKYLDGLRTKLGITQAEMARCIGVSQQAVFAYLTGQRRPSVLVLSRIAVLFDMSLDQLSGRKPPPTTRRRRFSPRAAMLGERIRALPRAKQKLLLRIIETFEDLAELPPLAIRLYDPAYDGPGKLKGGRRNERAEA